MSKKNKKKIETIEDLNKISEIQGDGEKMKVTKINEKEEKEINKKEKNTLRTKDYKDNYNLKMVSILINYNVNEFYKDIERFKKDGVGDEEMKKLIINKELKDTIEFIRFIAISKEAIEFVEDHIENLKNLFKMTPDQFTGLRRLIH